MEIPNRESRIHSLWDVCSCELLCRKLGEETAGLEADSRHCMALMERTPLRLEKPGREQYQGDAGILLFVLLGALSLLLMVWLSVTLRKRLLLLAVAAFWLCGAAQAWKEEQGKLDARFEREEALYQSRLQYNEGLAREALELKAQIEENDRKKERLQAGLQEAEDLREALYVRNRIPDDFRTCAGVCYLCLTCAASYETDLDALIHGLLPEEIRRCMEDYLCPDWENMLACRREQAVAESRREEAGDSLHRRLNALLLNAELE